MKIYILRRLFNLLFLACLIFGLSSQSHADKIDLVSGEGIRGKNLQESGDYIKMDFYDVPIIFYKKFSRTLPYRISSKAKKCYLNSLRLIEEGRWQEASREFESAVMLSPNFPPLLFNLGSTYTVLGQYNKAVNAYEKAVALDPQLSWAYGHLGKNYYYLGKLANSLKALEKAIELDPSYKEASSRLSFIYFNQSKKTPSAI